MSKPKPSPAQGPDEGHAAHGLVVEIMRAVEQYNRETGLCPQEPPANTPRSKRPATRRKRAD